jgi:UDP-3-O-[3-hydroxymyristoyl] glucosamine N-acyltransferase
MPFKLIIGEEPWLSIAVEDNLLVDSTQDITAIPLNINSEYKFDLSFLEDFDPKKYTGFIAWGSSYSNFQRLDLMGELKKKGFRLPPLINPNAQVSANLKILENSWVQSGCVISSNVTIGYNVCLCMGVKVGPNTHIGNSTWIGENSSIGYMCNINSNVTLGSMVTVKDSLKIGNQVIIEHPMVVEENLQDKKFFLKTGNVIGEIINYKYE